MLAMQYSVRLPSEFNLDKVYERVSLRGPMFDGCPGLAHKFYLYEKEEHLYAPLYIWENTQSAQDFLMNSLFGDVVQDFGRPRVRSWQILDFAYGPSSLEPVVMTAEVDKVCSKDSLSLLKQSEAEHHKKMLAQEGLFAHMTLLDPDRWEISRCSLWSKKPKSYKPKADCVYEYEVVKEKIPLSGAA